MVTVRTIKYRLYPKKSQVHTLNTILAVCCDVYNSLLHSIKVAYETEGIWLSRYTQCKNLTKWKSTFDEIKAVHSHVLQEITQRVDFAYKSFFKRVKNKEAPAYPRCKTVPTYDSFTFPDLTNCACRIVGNFINIPKVGLVKCVIPNLFDGIAKRCVIRRHGDKWYACISYQVNTTSFPDSITQVGLDMGVEKFASLSTGEYIQNPRFYQIESKQLARAQSKWSNQKLGSVLRKKYSKVVRRIHERIRNKRNNFLHQESRRIIDKFGLIVVEKLNIKSMMKRPKTKKDGEGNTIPSGACFKKGLNKSIGDTGWFTFKQMLIYKAESANRQLIEVNPAYTSQICSGCGFKEKKLLKERIHTCKSCGLILDRDTNASLNILGLGLQSISVNL